MQSSNRRNFIKTTSLAALATVNIPQILSASFKAEKVKKISLKKNDIILFQGDSITDWGRDKKATESNKSNTLGPGYPIVASAQLLWQYPALGLKIYNKGISGQKVFQLADRWDTDTIDLQPTVLSILVGVNDYWHTLGNGYKGTIDTYRTDYKKLLERTKKALPNVRLIIMEPYAIKGVKAVDDKWFPAFDAYRQVAKETAAAFGATFIPLQTIFEKAMEVAPGSYWTIDGVHPSVAGEGLIAHAWLEAVKS